jgi:DNA-binding NarL/FixJ family response regulator
VYRTLIVDDDPVAKKLFTLFVRNSGDFELAGVLESAGVAESFCLGNRVDLILMDICTAGHSSGLEAAIKIKRSMPRVKVVIVTSQPEVDFTDRALAGGVDSFYYKTTEEMELLDVMRRTMAGESVYPGVRPTVRLGLISEKDLTELEIKILRELTSGDPTKPIAARLHLSERTVDNNISRMLEKTGFATRTKLACAAVDSGIVIKDI